MFGKISILWITTAHLLGRGLTISQDLKTKKVLSLWVPGSEYTGCPTKHDNW